MAIRVIPCQNALTFRLNRYTIGCIYAISTCLCKHGVKAVLIVVRKKRRSGLYAFSSFGSYMNSPMPVSPAFCVLRALVLGGAVALAGCSTTGNPFNTADLRFLEPGHTTLQEASIMLQGEPVNVYRQLDGSAVARWAHKTSILTDAIYRNQELWLAFDSYGRFQRVVKGNSIPSADLYQDGRRVDLPAAQAAETPVPPTSVSYPLAL